ncbi:MAG: TIM barrel protein [Prevotella sp.]|nr:TIM barrel protein [Prevotella sp.]
MTLRSARLLLFVALWYLYGVPVEAQESPKRYRIAACDWMMLKRQKLGVFALAHEIGADGVELDMGPLGKRLLFDNQLRDDQQAVKFLHKADSFGIEVPSIAMSGFFAQNFLTRDNYQDLIHDCIATMRRFRAKVAFLPLGGSGNEWKRDGAQRNQMIKRLRVAGEMMCAAGFTLGIRTQLTAKENIQLLKQIGCPAVKLYYNFQDAADAGRDIPKELKKLGRNRIVQIHASNTDSVNLREDSEIDLPCIKQTLDKIGWHGWLVVERSRDTSRIRDVKYNFERNVAYLKEVFQSDEK